MVPEPLPGRALRSVALAVALGLTFGLCGRMLCNLPSGPRLEDAGLVVSLLFTARAA